MDHAQANGSSASPQVDDEHEGVVPSNQKRVETSTTAYSVTSIFQVGTVSTGGLSSVEMGGNTGPSGGRRYYK